jgi:O-antigen ligase
MIAVALFLYYVLVSWNARTFLLVLSLPLTVLSYYVGFTLKLWMLLLVIAAGFWVVEIMLRRKSIQRTLLNQLLILLLIANIISVCNAVNVIRSVRIIIQYAMLSMLAVYVINDIDSKAKIRSVIKMILVSGMCISVFGIVQWLGNMYGYDVRLPFESYLRYSDDMTSALHVWAVNVGGKMVPRIRGPFPDPNVMGGFILSFLPLLVSLTMYRIVKGKTRAVFVMASILTVVALLGTVSRTAIMGMILGVGLVLFYWRKMLLSQKMVRVLFIAGIVFVFAVIVIPGELSKVAHPYVFVERIAQTFDPNDTSTVTHRQLAILAVKMWFEHPIIGVGVGNYGAYYSPGSQGNGSSHTALLTFFAETGIIGGVVNLSIIGFLIYFLIKLIRMQENYSYWFAVDVGLLASYISTISGNITYIYYNEAFIWFLMGLIISAGRVQYAGRESNNTPERTTA